MTYYQRTPPRLAELLTELGFHCYDELPYHLHEPTGWIVQFSYLLSVGSGEHRMTVVSRQLEQPTQYGVFLMKYWEGCDGSAGVEKLKQYLRDEGFPVDATLRNRRLLALIS